MTWDFLLSEGRSVGARSPGGQGASGFRGRISGAYFEGPFEGPIRDVAFEAAGPSETRSPTPVVVAGAGAEAEGNTEWRRSPHPRRGEDRSGETRTGVGERKLGDGPAFTGEFSVQGVLIPGKYSGKYRLRGAFEERYEEQRRPRRGIEAADRS